MSFIMKINYPARNIYQVDEYTHCFRVNYENKQVKRAYILRHEE